MLLPWGTASPQCVSSQVLASGWAFEDPKPEQTANVKGVLDTGLCGQDMETAGDTNEHSWSVLVKASGLVYSTGNAPFRKPREYSVPPITYIYTQLNLEKSKGYLYCI